MGRRGYSAGFRRRVVDLVAAGRKVAEVARDLGVSDQTSYSWRRQAAIDRGRAPGLSSPERGELAAAKRRIRELETELAVHRLAALRVRYFFSFGLAGGLQPHSRVGDIVVCARAMRDEGVSHHYLPPEAAAAPSPRLTQAVDRRLSERGAPFQRGMTWTIDTPYRETVDEMRHYRRDGVLTVEMEAAALFAVAAVRGVEAASVFVLSDLLGETEWTPEFGADLLNSQLELVADAGIQAVLDLATI